VFSIFQGGILNISRKQRQQKALEESVKVAEEEEEEEEPLLGKQRHRIN
jgi:hypothetical protein